MAIIANSQRIENAKKIIENFRDTRNEWHNLWGVLYAGHALKHAMPYCNVTIAERLEELKQKLLAR